MSRRHVCYAFDGDDYIFYHIAIVQVDNNFAVCRKAGVMAFVRTSTVYSAHQQPRGIALVCGFPLFEEQQNCVFRTSEGFHGLDSERSLAW